MIKKIHVKIVGISPLIMHNGEIANPLDNRPLPDFLQKELGFKTMGEAHERLKKKKDKDYAKLAKLGFYSSLYLNKQNKVIYPAMCLERMIVEQSKEFKDGLSTLQRKAKRAICINKDALLDFPNKNKPLKDLYEPHRYDTMVKVSMSKTPRTRAIFQQWSCEFVVELMEKVIDIDTLREILELGIFYGSLERRPKFGRYKVKSIKTIK